MALPKCPRCKTRLVDQAHQEGGVERLLGLLTLYPFRCQLCAHRFRAFYWRYSYNPRREYERVSTPYTATLHQVGAPAQDRGILGMVLNLSVSGCQVETNAHVLKGTSLRLIVQVSKQFAPVEVERAVVRSVQDGRLGLEFLKLAPEQEKRLRIVMEANLLTRPR